MGISKLASVAATMAFMAAASGNLPWILKKAKIAQIKLLQESRASNWG